MHYMEQFIVLATWTTGLGIVMFVVTTYWRTWRIKLKYWKRGKRNGQKRNSL